LNVWIAGNGLVFPHGNASTNRLVEIAKGFESNGCKVKLIPMGVDKKSPSQKKGIYKQIKFQFITNIVEKSSSVQTVFNPYFYAKKTSKQLSIVALNDKVDYIFCGSSSLYTIFLLYFTSLNLNIKFIYDIVEDPFSSWIAKDTKAFSLIKWGQHLINLINIPFYYFYAWRLPDYLSVITNEQKNKLIKLRINSQLISIIPILKYFQKNENHEYTNGKIDNDVLIHSGSTYFPKDGIQLILDAIKIVVSKGINIKLELYGPIGKIERIKINRFICNNKLEQNIKIYGLVELDFLFKRQSQALALICFKPLIKQNRYNFATKIIDYLDAERPVILSDLPEYTQYFITKKNAIICNEITAVSLAQNIGFLYRNPEIANIIGRNGKKTLSTKFNATFHISHLLEKLSD
jgi:glycosyltransferase involved in cell wall biosynthesis